MKHTSHEIARFNKWSMFFILFIALTVLSVPAVSESTSFLWEVKSDTSTAYVLGSIHYLKESMYPLPSQIENAFSGSDTLVVEVDISGNDAAKMQELMLLNSLYTDGTTLKDHISDSTYELAKKTFEDIGLPLESAQMFKPWALALTLTSMEVMKLGYNPEHGIDKYFLNKARADKKILALETAEFQVNLLSSLPDDDQDAFLAYTIRDLDLISGSVEGLVKAWSTGDTGGLESILLQNVKDAPQFEHIYDTLIYDRNRTMSEKIDGYLKDKGTYFVVIGAGHLVGNKGVINLLKEKGYKVSQQ